MLGHRLQQAGCDIHYLAVSFQLPSQPLKVTITPTHTGLFHFEHRQVSLNTHIHWQCQQIKSSLPIITASLYVNIDILQHLPWTVSAPDKVTAVPVRRNENFQTPISVPAVRPKRWHTLSNPAHRQDYTVACLNYTLQTMMPLSDWPVMAPNAYDNNNIICSLQTTIPVAYIHTVIL